MDQTIARGGLLRKIGYRLALVIAAFGMAASAFAQPANQNISGGLVFEGEPFMAVDPADAQHIVVAWIGFVFQNPSGIKTRTSFDGGQTWSNAVVLPHWRSTYKSADPSIVYDTNGDVVACYVDYRQNPDSGGTFVVRSTDGGLTWGSMSEVIDGYDDGTKIPVDRPWLTIDRSGGATSGNLYVTTKPAPWVPAPNRAYFMRSTDAGATWSNWRHIDSTGYLIGNFIAAPMSVSAVSSSGVLHIMYPSYVLSQNLYPGFILASSTNGGNGFTYRNAWFEQVNGSDSLIKAGYQLLTDPSDPNHLAFISPVNVLGDQDVYAVQSWDGGVTWSPKVRVNDDPASNGVTQDLVWGGFDADGDLVVTWRDRRNASGTGYYQVDSEIWGSVLWKDSMAFSPNFRISDTLAAWNAILTQAGNDFMCNAMAQDTLLATWGDTRNGRLNIYFTKIDLRSMVGTGIHQLGSEALPQIKVYPNPVSDYLMVEGEGILEMELRDLSGRLIMEAERGPMQLSGLPSGVYLLEVRTEAGEFEAKVQKQ